MRLAITRSWITLLRSAVATSSRLARSGRHCRRVMVHYHPFAAVVLDHREAVAGRDRLRFAVLRVRKGVIPGVYGRIAVDPHQLVAERHLEARQRLESPDEILADGRGVGTYRRRD